MAVNIKVQKVAKELSVGAKAIVDYLTQKNPESETSYTINSKLTTDDVKSVVSAFGNSLDPKAREDVLSKLFDSEAKEIKTSTPIAEVKEPLSTPKREEKSFELKIKGHVTLDERGNVIATPTAKTITNESTSQSIVKEDTLSKAIPNHKEKEVLAKPVANEVLEEVVNVIPKNEEPKVQAPLPDTDRVTAETTKSPNGKATSTPENIIIDPNKKQILPTSKEHHPIERSMVDDNKEKQIDHSSSKIVSKQVEISKTASSVKHNEETGSHHLADKKGIVSEQKKTASEQHIKSDIEPAEPKENKNSNFVKIEAPKLQGVTFTGQKIDVSDYSKGPKKKRNRIKGNKVDIDKEQRNASGDEAKKKGSQHNKNNQQQNLSSSRNNNNQRKKEGAGSQGNNNSQKGQNNTQNTGNTNNKQEKGRKVKRQQQLQKQQNQLQTTPEISKEDIDKRIKETMGAIQESRRSSLKQSAEYRRDKREAAKRERELKEQQEREDKTLQLTEYVTANDLSQMIDVEVNEIITLCFSLGKMISINQRMDKETIDLILEEYGYEPVYVEAQMLDMIEPEPDAEDDLKPRAPVVTVMGHVDHGKTSLLDAIRHTDVTKGEAGGITQHVGAYQVTLEDGRAITFLDTPGHEAFTAMRARGAQVTDIVIIVVAADDGVMPQTKEALSHASLAGVPIVFAINKIDKPSANPDRIKEELAQLNYLVEDWGGKYQSQEISAKSKIGIKDLLEKVLLEAEILELKANPNKRAVGTVLESTLEQGRGYTTKVLIQQGTLRVGDDILAGANYGRVKALFNEHGKNVKSVGPSEPVKVLGLNGATQAGEVFNVLASEAEVRDIANRRAQLKREQKERTQRNHSLMDLGRRIAEGQIQDLNIIVKGDMDGSVEALSDSIVKLSTEEIRVNVLHKAIGQISESDVILASASGAIIIGFQVRPGHGARRLAEEEGVEIRTYSIIYDALDDVKTAMEGMLSPELKERITANLVVKETFKIPKVGTIAGCFVEEGKISRTNKVRVIRDGVVVHTSKLASLKRFKDDAKEVVSGLECGLSIDNYNDIQVGDTIEAYEEIEVKRTL